MKRTTRKAPIAKKRTLHADIAQSRVKSSDNDTDTNVDKYKMFSPFYERLNFLILMMIFITPIGVFLWFKYYKRPHIAIKIIISFLWLFWWVVFTLALVLTATGN
jgi:hypothetical protein